MDGMGPYMTMENTVNEEVDLCSFLNFENEPEVLSGCKARRNKDKPLLPRKQSSAPVTFED